MKKKMNRKKMEWTASRGMFGKPRWDGPRVVVAPSRSKISYKVDGTTSRLISRSSSSGNRPRDFPTCAHQPTRERKKKKTETGEKGLFFCACHSWSLIFFFSRPHAPVRPTDVDVSGALEVADSMTCDAMRQCTRQYWYRMD